MSTQEIARAIKTNERQARSIVDSVSRKLHAADGRTLMTW